MLQIQACGLLSKTAPLGEQATFIGLKTTTNVSCLPAKMPVSQPRGYHRNSRPRIPQLLPATNTTRNKNHTNHHNTLITSHFSLFPYHLSLLLYKSAGDSGLDEAAGTGSFTKGT
jgi:hypothetical protein